MKKRLVVLRKRLGEVTQTNYFVFLVAALLGGAFFVSFFGFRILDPTFTDWLMYGGDLKQHFIGWVMYRDSNDPLSFGNITQLAYPFGLPLTYMDSIPLVAIPLAFFSSVLPDNFQYFGLWGLMCFMLQGGFAALIMRRWTKNVVLILLFATVLILSPMLLSRVFSHTALASHWLVLASIWFVLEWRRFASLRSQLIIWAVLLSLVILIHPYFLPMVGILFMISVILTHRKWVTTCIQAIVPPGIAIVIFGLIGGFTISETNSDGLGGYGFNLNSLVNPLGWSKFLNTMPNASPSGETLNYLGLGVILLIPLALYLLLCSARSWRSAFLQVRRSVTRKHILIGLLVLFLFILAVSPRVQLGTLTLINVSLPELIEEKWAIFRASARLFWPIYYLIVIGLFAYIIVQSRNKISEMALVILLSVVVVIQVVDIRFSQAAKNKRESFIAYSNNTYKPTLSVARWGALIDKDEHLVYLGDMTNKSFLDLSDIAIKYGLSMNDGYFARTPEAQIANYENDQKKLLFDGRANIDDNLYVTADKTLAENLRAQGRYKVSLTDGYYVVH